MGLEAKGTFPFQMYQIPEFTATTVTTAPTPPAKASADKPKVVEPATRSEITIDLTSTGKRRLKSYRTDRAVWLS